MNTEIIINEIYQIFMSKIFSLIKGTSHYIDDLAK